MTNTQPNPTQPSNEMAVTKVGKYLADSIIPPDQMARKLNTVYFCMVKESDLYQDMTESERAEIDCTFYVLNEGLLRLNEARVAQ